MSDHVRTTAEPARAEPEPGLFDRFPSLTRRLVHVSKDDVREAEVREHSLPRTA